MAFFNLKTPEPEVCRSVDAMLRGDTQTSTAQTRARAVDESFATDLTVRDL